MTLPRKLKSGRALVATASEGHVGLYGSAEAGYRVVLPDRRVVNRPLGAGGYPRAPDGNWTWRAGEKPGPVRAAAQRDRRSDRERGEEAFARRERGVGKSSGPAPAPPPAKLSRSIACADCGVNTHERKHSHTSVDGRGYPVAVCCRCTRKRGHICLIYERAKRRRAARERASAKAGH